MTEHQRKDWPMIPNMNLSEARRETVKPGGYIVRVIAVRIDTKYNRLQLDVDIVEGEHQGYYTRLNERFDFWGMTINLYLDPKSAWKFAKTIDAFRDSNADFTWNDDGENDERSLIGMYVGLVTREKEYMGNDGVKKTKLIPYITLPIADIRSGNFEVPEKLLYEGGQDASAASNEVVDTTVHPGFVESDTDLPF